MGSKRKAVIIGGGIGGLAAAIALRQAGAEVNVFEQASALGEVGAGISLWANAIHALRKLGVGEALQAASAPYAIDGLRSWDGTHLTSVSMSTLEDKVGVPIVILHRAELLALLRAAIGRENVHLGARCVCFQQDASAVHVQFEGHEPVKADLLIGADGLHSVVRAALHGDQPPRYAGCTAWRAVVPFKVRRVRATETWGSGSVFGQVPMSGNRVYWYATKNGPAGERHASEKSELSRLFRGWHSPIEELIRATDDSIILRNDIYDRPGLKKWGKGRVTLLGDAAHPMTPYLGQGGCQALEDAVVLGECLSNADFDESGLRAYEARRIGRTNALVGRSRLIGRIAQMENPLASWLRNAALRLISPRLQASQLAWIAGHRV